MTSFLPTLRGSLLLAAMGVGALHAPHAEAMSKKDKQTLIGVVVGGLAGSLVSNGDPWAAAGGALAGGAIGNVTADGKDNRDRRNDRDWQRQHDQRQAWERREAEKRERERRERDRRARERAHWNNR